MFKRIYHILFFFLAILSAHADETDITDQTNIVTVPAGTVVPGDYFACGSAVEISGTVRGDVYVFGSQVTVDGTVEGDVLVAAGGVDISGVVQGNVRALAGQVVISGRVGRNVTAVAGSLQLISSGYIVGNVVCVTGTANVASTIGSNLTFLATNFRLSSEVKHNVVGFVDQMRLTSKAAVGGNIEYSSSHVALIEPLAKVGGQIVHHPSFYTEIVGGEFIQRLLLGSKVAAVLMNFIFTFVVGCILIRIYPKNIEAAVDRLQHTPWKALGYGLMLLILLPLASFILLMSILGAPFALALIALNIVGFYTAKIVPVLLMSNQLFPRLGFQPNRIPTFAFGLIIYFMLVSIPVFGMLLAIAAVIFGFGAGALARSPRKRHGS